MEKLLILFLVLALFSNCNRAEKKSDDKIFSITNSMSKSEVFTINEDYFEATLSTVTRNQRGKADGEYYFQRIGSLSYIISELYQKPITLLNNPYSHTSYELVINWDQQLKFDKVQQEVLYKLKEEFDYSVSIDTREKKQFVLFINDLDKLHKAKLSANSGALYKSSLEDGVWKIQATLDKLVNAMNELSNHKVVSDIDHSSTIYNFTLYSNRGLLGMLEQLNEDYGIAYEEEVVNEKHYYINFEKNEEGM